MSLKDGEKYFHLSEIFSYYNTGTQMYLPEESKMPDGEFRSIMLAFEAAVKVAQHVSGRKLWDDRDPHRFNIWDFMNVCDEVDEELIKQLPWLKEIEFPPELFLQDTEAAIQARRDWVRKMAQELGSEWFALKPKKDPEQPPNGMPLRPPRKP